MLKSAMLVGLLALVPNVARTQGICGEYSAQVDLYEPSRPPLYSRPHAEPLRSFYDKNCNNYAGTTCVTNGDEQTFGRPAGSNSLK